MTDTVSRPPLRIVSTTITRLADAHKVPDALRSTEGLADERHVIWTSPDLIPIEIVDSDARIHCFAWTGRFDDARNESLRVAREAGADWSAMVDSDETLVMPNPQAVRDWLADLPARVQIVCALSAEGTYQRERFFRGTIPQRWKFRTHESIDSGEGEQVTIPPELIVWAELPKTGEQVRAKSERDLELIKQDLLEHPTEGRLLFYLGNTLSHLGRYDEAIDAYRKVAEIGTGEGCAWACFCAARIYFEKGKDAGEKRGDTAEMWRCVNKALDCCAAGIHRETRIAELHWLRAAILHGVGKHEEAIAWAEQAKVHGYGSRSYPSRHGFMVPHALKEGPDYVISMCLASIAAGDVPKPPEPMAGIRFPEAQAPLVVAPATWTGSGPGPIACEARGRHASAVWKEGDSTETLAVACPEHLVAPGAPCWRQGPARIEIVREPVHITVTSSAYNAGRWAERCVRSVREQTFEDWNHIFIDAKSEDGTEGYARRAAGDEPRTRVSANVERRLGVFENMLPVWRLLPPQEVVVWLDGDDCLATDTALARVAEEHANGAWVTYGQFLWASSGKVGFAAPVGQDPRTAPWTATILRTFRAGLVQRITEEDLRWTRELARKWSLAAEREPPPYIGDACDQAIMLPVLEMAGAERARFLPNVVAIYNDSNFLNLSERVREREAEAVRLIRSRKRYERVGAL